MLLRADDLGFSQAVNYGIVKTIRDGLIRNCGVMVNMEATEHAVRLLEGLDCCLGLHCNVSVGRPVLSPEELPSLVNEKGFFHSSREYRQAEREFADTEQLCRELTAQYRRFVSLFGRKPAYFEAHAVKSRNLSAALEQVAAENGLFYQPSSSNFTLGGTDVINLPMHSMEPGYDARRALKQTLSGLKDGCYLYVCHPGYLDQYLLENSSLTLPRADEADMLCDKETGRWLEEQGFALVTYTAFPKADSESKYNIKIRRTYTVGIFSKLFGNSKNEEPVCEPLTVYAPADGTAIPLENFPDERFSQGVLGPGCGILPSGKLVTAPFNGTVIQASDTLHAVGLSSSDGVELLIHVGVDTVEMAGKGFKYHVKNGQKVRLGQPLIEFDSEQIKAAGHADAIAVVVINGDDYAAVELQAEGAVTAGVPLLKTEK